MTMPGFSAERSLAPRALSTPDRAQTTDGAPVIPARPKCEACEIICRNNPNCGCWNYCD